MASYHYEDSAAAFLDHFRGSFESGEIVRGEDIVKWAHDHGNGLASDLLIADPGKKLGAVKRHLNSGAESRNFAEAERYVIDTVSAKRQLFKIRPLAEYRDQKAEEAFSKSITGCINPLVRSQEDLEDIKREELNSKQRAELEAKLKELIEAATPAKKLLGEQTVNRWVARLEAKGFTATAARNLVEFLPQLQRLIKLIKLTTT